jgi:plastocyanin
MWDRRGRSGETNHRTLQILLAGVTAIVLVFACGCGQESVDASATATTRVRDGMAGLQGGVDGGMPAAVTMTDGLQFEPARLTVPLGTTLVWRNTSTMSHTVTANPAQAMTASNVQLPAGTAPFESPTLQPGQTFAHQFTVAGEYRYVCHIHEGSGMVGIITVE